MDDAGEGTDDDVLDPVTGQHLQQPFGVELRDGQAAGLDRVAGSG